MDPPEVAQPDIDGPETDVLPPGDVDETDTLSDDVDGPDVQPADVVNVEFPCLSVGCSQPIGPSCVVEPGWCFIGNACQPEGGLNPGNTCQVCNHAEDTLGWTLLPNDTSCDDGVSCTKDEICKSGVCGGGVEDCPTTATCLQLTCDLALDACVDEVKDGCFVSGDCYLPGQSAADKCGSCRPSENDRDWTPGDSNESDDTFADANDLATPAVRLDIAQDTGWMPAWNTSRISPPEDIDVFKILNFGQFSRATPFARVANLGGQDLQACVWMRCRSTDDVQIERVEHACVGASPVSDMAETGESWVGCCRVSSDSSFVVGIDSADCIVRASSVIAPREAKIVVSRPRPVQGSACLSYALQWGLK